VAATPRKLDDLQVVQEYYLGRWQSQLQCRVSGKCNGSEVDLRIGMMDQVERAFTSAGDALPS
jgi:hypothetical protein